MHSEPEGVGFTLSGDEEVRVLSLQRPFSLDSQGKAALTGVMEKLNRTAWPRVLILTATEPRAFLVDVAELADMKPEDAHEFSVAGHKLARAIEDAPCPIIAAVEGAALGGGCELVLACDIAICGKDARFGQIEALGGVMPGFGGTWRLARRVGYPRAMEMLFTEAVMDAETAHSCGLVLEVAPKGNALDRARVVAERILRTSKASVRAIKKAATLGWNLAPGAADAIEEALFSTLFGGEQSARMHAYLKQQSAKQR